MTQPEADGRVGDRARPRPGQGEGRRSKPGEEGGLNDGQGQGQEVGRGLRISPGEQGGARTGVGAGGPAHGWCSWGQNSPCGYSHTGSGQGRSGHRSPGAGMGSNNRGSLQRRSRDQRPLRATPPPQPHAAADGEAWGQTWAMDSSHSSVLTHPGVLSGLQCSP